MKKNETDTGLPISKSPFSTEDIAVSASLIQQELETYIDPVKREYLPDFFKTGKYRFSKNTAK